MISKTINIELEFTNKLSHVSCPVPASQDLTQEVARLTEEKSQDQFWAVKPATTRCEKWIYIYICIYTIWLFNIAMENSPFIGVYLLKMVIFHGYVKYPEDIYIYIHICR